MLRTRTPCHCHRLHYLITDQEYLCYSASPTVCMHYRWWSRQPYTRSADMRSYTSLYTSRYQYDDLSYPDSVSTKRLTQILSFSPITCNTKISSSYKTQKLVGILLLRTRLNLLVLNSYIIRNKVYINYWLKL